MKKIVVMHNLFKLNFFLLVSCVPPFHPLKIHILDLWETQQTKEENTQHKKIEKIDNLCIPAKFCGTMQKGYPGWMNNKIEEKNLARYTRFFVNTLLSV
jgi:hypothetical protein